MDRVLEDIQTDGTLEFFVHLIGKFVDIDTHLDYGAN